MGMEGMFDAPIKALALCLGVLICIVIAGVALVVCAMHYDGKDKEYAVYHYGNVMNIEACGETHQYLMADRGICHLPNCKYCCQKGSEK